MSKLKLPEGYELIDGSRIVDQIKADRNKIPKNSGTITSNGKVLAPKEHLLKRIEIYNDLIDQTDSNRDKIIVDRDYDFNQFKEGDYIAEINRIDPAIRDIELEDRSNANGREFAGKELENGVPSYEAVKEMSPEQFKAYEEKYLSDTFKKIDEQKSM